MKHHIPNSLTMLRIVLAVGFGFVPESWRLPIFVVAAFTEFADGFLARKLGVISSFGRILDPIADKLFVFAVVVTIFLEGWVELWELLAIGMRDMAVFIAVTGIWLFGDRAEFQTMKPRVLGKLTTNFQFAFLLYALVLHDVHLALIIATSAVSAAAAVDYFVSYRRDYRRS